MRQTFTVSSFIWVSIGKVLLTPAMLEEVLEAAFISLPTFAFMNTFALYNSFLPLSHVAIAFWRNPQTNSMLLISNPFARVKLAIRPSKLSLSLLLVIYIGTSVSPKSILLYPLHFVVIFPCSLKDISLFDKHTKAVTLFDLYFSKIKIIIFIGNWECLFFDKLYDVDLFETRLIRFNKCWHSLLCW